MAQVDGTPIPTLRSTWLSIHMNASGSVRRMLAAPRLHPRTNAGFQTRYYPVCDTLIDIGFHCLLLSLLKGLRMQPCQPERQLAGEGCKGLLCRRGITHPQGGAAVLHPGLDPERWGDRHNRSKGLALKVWGKAPS